MRSRSPRRKATDWRLKSRTRRKDGMICMIRRWTTSRWGLTSPTPRGPCNRSRCWLSRLKKKKNKLDNFKWKFSRFRMTSKNLFKTLSCRNLRKLSRRKWLSLSYCSTTSLHCTRRCIQRPSWWSTATSRSSRTKRKLYNWSMKSTSTSSKSSRSRPLSTSSKRN